MLILERTSNGRTIVTIKRDWHPGRLGLAFVPKVRSMDTNEIKWQSALLKKSPI